MKDRKIRYIILFSLLLLCTVLLYFQAPLANEKKKGEEVKQIQNNPGRKADIPTKEWQQTVTIGAVGDILLHDRVYNDAKSNESYDFKPMLSEVKDELLKPDILLANQETVLGGKDIGLSSYPTFNSPQEAGDALIDSGVDIVSTANNHSLDKGEKGIQNAIAYYQKVKLPYVGAFKNQKDKMTLRILEKKGVKIAYLSYTYGTNGIPVPNGKEYLVNLIDKNTMHEEIGRARQAADAVVMSIHWGNEYQRFPSEEQKELASFIANEGVDVIFGHHPHVLQPMDWIERKDGNRTLVVYSLGNFLSGQVWDYKDIGGLAIVNLTKTVHSNETSIKISQPTFFPTFVSSFHQTNYRVVPLKDAGHFGLTNASEKYQEIMEHMKMSMEPGEN
ncbi:CapA family protein [Bacillus massilinigeriensis]|uniref:CapA family protein n=1 Tax=Bacillus mediterraneensis TaxID=1805474 RepID=UPI0008F7F870|nr:CapA family protein [Bacillus mediterraneensis]